MAIQWKYIKRWEGTNKVSSLYVPTIRGRVIERSGVTAPCGLDLGQLDANGLLKFNFSTHINKILHKYLGIRGSSALDLLNENILDKYLLTKSDYLEIEYKVHQVYENKVKREFNAFSKGTKFEELTDIQQTVIASVRFQHGSLRRAAPNFFRQVLLGDWRGAIRNLRRFTTKKDSKGRMLHSWRRNEEADLLEKDLYS